MNRVLLKRLRASTTLKKVIRFTCHMTKRLGALNGTAMTESQNGLWVWNHQKWEIAIDLVWVSGEIAPYQPNGVILSDKFFKYYFNLFIYSSWYCLDFHINGEVRYDDDFTVNFFERLHFFGVVCEVNFTQDRVVDLSIIYQ